MKTILLQISIIITVLTIPVKAQITFQKNYGFHSNAFAGGLKEVDVVLTYGGGYCITGIANINNGDILLMKLNENGDTLWTKTYGGNFDDKASAIKQTADSGFIICGNTRSFSQGQSDAYIIRTDSEGNLLWSKNYGGFSWESFESIELTNDNNGFIACGYTQTFGAGSSDIYIVKIDFDGNIIWTKTVGGNGIEWGYSIYRTYDNGFIVTGSTTSFTAGSQRIYLFKLDAAGNVSWSKIYGGVMGDCGLSVRQCLDSGYVVTGYTNSYGAGVNDAFLLKTDESGNLQWMKTYGGAYGEIGFNVEQTSDKGFIIVGNTQSFGSYAGVGSDLYLIKTNFNGDTLWTMTYLSTINGGYCVKPTPNNEFIIVSSPNTISVIKTDSMGRSGCNEFSANTLVDSVSPVLLTGALTGFGGSAFNASTLLRNYTITIDSLCNSTGNKIPAMENSTINVYPNPFNEYLIFESVSGEMESIIIYNVLFQPVLKKEFRNSTSIDTEILNPGFYLYEVRNDKQKIASGKIFKP